MSTMATENGPPLAKKAKTAVESCLGLGPQGNLQSMFAHGFCSGCSGRTPGTGTAATNSTAGANHFFTLRLEHRMGDRGEERILLFRSDCRGAIAKIIYSSELPERIENIKPPAIEATGVCSSELQDRSTSNLKPPPTAASSGPVVEAPTFQPVLRSTAYAKIHALNVKAQYRGLDLGGLLFSEAIASLRERYCDNDVVFEGECTPNNSSKGYKQIHEVECVLDAEEDASRAGKLVSFYEQLGCRVKPSKREQYVHNNDNETYRKIPMQIDLHPPRANTSENLERARLRRKTLSHLRTSKKDSFLPIRLVGSLGKLKVLSYDRRNVMKLDWLVTETPNKGSGIQFCTTLGHLLLATPSGIVTVLSPANQDKEDDYGLDCGLKIDNDALYQWSHFIPCPISDEEDTEGDDFSQSKSLWVLRTVHGSFLSADSLSQTLSCTKTPSFWQANGGNLSLACTSDTPPRRHHYRKNWKYQRHDYVQMMRSRFLKFSLGRATLLEALHWIHAYPAHPFHVWTPDESNADFSPDQVPSLRTLSFQMAEAARKEGFPDWLQLVALFHELGEAVKTLDPKTGDMAKTMYDWTISSRSRVIGCKVPQRATFHEFRHLNMDEDDPRYNSERGIYQPKCGLDNVLLQWCGCEYVYHLLKHNSTLPNEALAAMRLFLLGDWHEHGEYSTLTNAADENVLQFVQDFDVLRRRVRLECVDCVNLTDEQCSNLWDSHFGALAAKYECDHVLNW